MNVRMHGTSTGNARSGVKFVAPIVMANPGWRTAHSMARTVFSRRLRGPSRCPIASAATLTAAITP